MKQIGMIGSHVIHSFAYAEHFNRADMPAVRAAEAIPSWQQQMLIERPMTPTIEGVELTHVFGENRDVAQDMVDIFHLTCADSAEQVIEACDLVMVMDEKLESRAALTEQALRAGRPTFVDKVPSLDPAETRRLIELAGEQGKRLAAWSQLAFASELNDVRDLAAGGVAHVGFHLTPDIFDIYAIHPINALQAAFPGRFKRIAPLPGDGMFLLEHEAGTRIVLSLGESFPAWHVRIDYCAAGAAVLVRTLDRHAMFAAGARDVVALLGDAPTRLGDAEMIEASTLVDAIARRATVDLP